MKKEKTIQVNNLTAGDFPPAVRPFWENTPNGSGLQDLITLVAIVCYCALSPRLRTKYKWDYSETMLSVNLLCIGNSGVGKSVIRHVVNMLTKRLMDHDQAERDRQRAYRERVKRQGSNEEKEEEPLLAIRFLQKFTLPIAVKYCHLMYRKYGDWMPFFLFGDELASFTENKKSSGEFQSVARTAYMLGETYSRDTLYADGYNATVDINWCSVLVGQEYALQKFIDKEGVLLGDAGRHILMKLENTLGDGAGRLKELTVEQMRLIEETVDRLMNETYTNDDKLQSARFVDMAWIDADVTRWCNQQLKLIAKSGSKALESFYVRASASAFRLCTMLYHLWGEDAGKQWKVRRCYYYYAQRILENCMNQWGAEYEAALPKKKEEKYKRTPLYDLMGKRWTRDQLAAMIESEGLGSPARTFIGKWLTKKWIYEVEPNVYEKLME